MSFIAANKVYSSTNKTNIVRIETELFFLFFLPGADAPRVYVRAWRLCCFHSPIYSQYPNLSEGADRVGGQLRGDKECPFSGVAKSGRVWRKVPESGARSVVLTLSVSKVRGLSPSASYTASITSMIRFVSTGFNGTPACMFSSCRATGRTNSSRLNKSNRGSVFVLV